MAKYFVDCVEEVGGCPSLLRTDCGTENVVIAGVQSFLRVECDDDLAGEKAHRYGPSTGNQWIEAWRSSYHRSHLTFSRTLWTREYFYLAIHFIRNAYGSALQS